MTTTAAEREMERARKETDAAMRAALRGRGDPAAHAQRLAAAIAAERAAREQVRGNG